MDSGRLIRGTITRFDFVRRDVVARPHAAGGAVPRSSWIHIPRPAISSGKQWWLGALGNVVITSPLDDAGGTDRRRGVSV